MRRFAVLTVAVSILASACLGFAEPDEPGAPQLGVGVVSTVHPLVSAAGAAMLEQGGNAVDAAAAVQWALNVVEPSMSGLGGGTLILLWLNETKSFAFFDGRETAPAASTKDQFMTPTGEPQPFATASTRGYAVGVPGTLAVFDLALRTHGRLPLAETLDPAIALAQDGFLVDRYLAGYIAGSETKLRSWPASGKLFFPGSTCPAEPVPTVGANTGCVGGAALKQGDRFVQPDLAKTFRTLQSRGLADFYEGDIAKAIVAAQAQRDGRMTAEDLRTYVAKERAPVQSDYDGFTVVSAPPPSAGGLTMLEMLNILEGVDLSSKGDRSVDALHYMIEAMHLAYQDRYAFIGDSDFVNVPVQGLLSKEFAAERRSLIAPDKANPSPRPGDPRKYEASSTTGPSQQAPTDAGDHTTHFVVVDGWGNVAAVTTTLESLFGTGIMVPGHGFLLNNQMTDFDFRPGGPNEVGPKKRPRSSMTPTVVLRDGAPVLALGSPGGPTITTTVMQVFLDVAEYGKGLDEAVKAPRIYSSDYPDVRWEPGIGTDVRDGLKARGHSPANSGSQIGNVQGVQWTGAGWVGVADTRAGQGGVAYVTASVA